MKNEQKQFGGKAKTRNFVSSAFDRSSVISDMFSMTNERRLAAQL